MGANLTCRPVQHRTSPVQHETRRQSRPALQDPVPTWQRSWRRSRERSGPGQIRPLLDVIGRFVHLEPDEGGKATMIFPRFQQLDAVRRMMAHARAHGAGNNYLIQHSAGSGKTNSIAWSAHFLADLHDANHKKLFDSVLVVSDRNVIDTQLQEAIFDFEAFWKNQMPKGSA